MNLALYADKKIGHSYNMNLMRKGIERKGCGLVAAYNAAILAGVPTSYDNVSLQARAWCGFRNEGMKTAKMTHLFRCLNVPTSRLKKGTPVNVALCALWEGHSVVFGYCDETPGSGHAIVVTSDFKVLNGIGKFKKWTTLFNAICTGEVSFNAWIVGKP